MSTQRDRFPTNLRPSVRRHEQRRQVVFISFLKRGPRGGIDLLRNARLSQEAGGLAPDLPFCLWRVAFRKRRSLAGRPPLVCALPAARPRVLWCCPDGRSGRRRRVYLFRRDLSLRWRFSFVLDHCCLSGNKGCCAQASAWPAVSQNKRCNKQLNEENRIFLFKCFVDRFYNFFL